MNINLGFFCFSSWNIQEYPGFESKGFWFRIFGCGLHVTNSMMLFSERNGIKKFVKLPFGYRLKLLKKNKY